MVKRTLVATLLGGLLLLGAPSVAFAGRGGNELARITAVEIVLMIVCGIGAAAGVAYGRSGRHGRGTLICFGALVCITAISIFWSIAPDLTWIEAARTSAYFAVCIEYVRRVTHSRWWTGTRSWIIVERTPARCGGNIQSV